ncbi:MAG: DNA mismatch repair protein MutS, partial [Treponema sp.]|nr:DNA mismatch repair protein MutS [Treponema sp.]
PVVEAHVKRGEFIPNDLALDAGGEGQNTAFALITGPNMAGKSTYLRQAALIILMAQVGSFVPASESRIGLVDRIYCRVGASDNLARGESTFLVEMNETAYILHTATERSFVIMDEVGRGTGTEDGLAIAWAVCEDLLDNIKCRTLFATHYHELSRIAHPRMANRSMDVAERDGQIVFLRKLREGPAAESYGLHVAALAGLNESLLGRAAGLMAMFSARKQKTSPETAPGGEIPVAAARAVEAAEDRRRAGGQKIISDLISELDNIEADAITPLEALNVICRWKKLLESASGGRAGRSGNSRPPPQKSEPPSLFDSF